MPRSLQAIVATLTLFRINLMMLHPFLVTMSAQLCAVVSAMMTIVVASGMVT